MTMLSNESGSVQIKRNPALKNIKIDAAVFDLVDFFYPILEFVQVLQLYMRPEDIMNVMNCSKDEAYKLYKEMQKYYGDESEYIRVLIPHFCDYMGVDELWIHLFLASLKDPRKSLAQQQSINGSVTQEMPLKLAQAIVSLKNGITISRETLQERTEMWKLLYPWGEPMAKRLAPYRMVIYADEVAAILRIHIRTAQNMLRDIRKELKMDRKLPVSIRKFCFYYPAYEEDEIRKALAIMYGEEDEEN